MKVVAFNGSAREGGNTEHLIRYVFEELEKESIEAELVNLAGLHPHGCIACYQCFERKDRRCAVQSDCINDCIEKMDAADGIILASPTYFADMSSELKIAAAWFHGPTGTCTGEKSVRPWWPVGAEAQYMHLILLIIFLLLAR